MARSHGSGRRGASTVKGGREASPWTGEQLRKQIPDQPETERQERRAAAARLRDGMPAPGEEPPTPTRRP
jgi:hypothetical protein